MTTVNFMSSAAAVAAATLTTAKISGFTPDGGNDKDDDTQLKFKLFVDLGGGFVQTVAETDFAAHGKFGDGQPWGPINIPVKGSFPIDKVSSLQGNMQFRPKGDDTWKFTYTLELSFNDGTIISRDGAHTVSENQTVSI
jgi:hypothetical protein